MQKLKLASLISEDQLKKRVKEIARELEVKLKGKDIVAICVLKGSYMFYADLIREMELDLQCEFLGVSSYHGGTQSSGEVKFTLDLGCSIQGKDILLIEDIVDTGLTMNFLISNLKTRNPKSITTATLLFKPDALKVPCELDYVGFKIGNEFVVGYGLDYQGSYRNLPYVARVDNLN